jgi:ribonuclease P protein component
MPHNLVMSDAPRRYRFTHAHRLHGARMFSAVYDAKVKKHVGPLTFFGKPNGLPHPRLGLSVPRRVGTAVVRNRVKRFIREAFRLSQHDWPRGYDVIVVVRPHETAGLADYQRMLFSGVRSLHQEWEKRERKAPEED